MRADNTPVIGPGYWTAISIASVFGANLGDFLSHVLHLGHVRGLPPLALLLAAILLAERRRAAGTVVWYWLAIVTLRTAATNLADLATHDFRIGTGIVVPVLAAVLAGLVVAGGIRTQAGGLPRTDLRYWAAMLVAGTLGTALGDALSDLSDMGPGTASVIDGAILALVFFAHGWSGSTSVPFYWLTIVAIRTAGTTLGDFSADSFGLVASTCLSGLLFASVLLALRRLRGGSKQSFFEKKDQKTFNI